MWPNQLYILVGLALLNWCWVNGLPETRHIRSDDPAQGRSINTASPTVQNIQYTEGGRNFTASTSSITYSAEHEIVEVIMWEETIVRLNYTIDCTQNTADGYTFTAHLISGNNIVSVAKVKPLELKDVMGSCEKSSDGVLSGNVEITLKGNLPGRSRLLIGVRNAVNLEGPSSIIIHPLSSVGNVSGGFGISQSPSNTSPAAAQAPTLGSNETDALFHGFGNSTWELIDQPFPASLRLVCKKGRSPLDTVFQVLMATFLVCMMVAMGCKTEMEVLKQVWHKPTAPIIGLACQFLFMPLIGFGLTVAAQFPSETMALGFFACGCAPGGGASNFYAFILRGDVTLSAAMTTVSNLVAIGTFPFWIFTLGRVVLTDQSEVKMPYVNMVISLLMIIIPLSVGMGIKHKHPRFTQRLLKILLPVTTILLIILPIVGIYLNFYMIRLMSSRLLLVSFFLPNLGFLCGLILARLFKQSWKFTRTIAIETGVQNVGIAFILVMFSFSQPDNILAATPAVTSSIMTSIPLLLAAGIFHTYLRCFKRKNKDTPLAYSIQYSTDGTAESVDFQHGDQEVMWDKTVM